MNASIGLMPIKGLVFTKRALNDGLSCSLHLNKKVVTEAGNLPICTYGRSCLAQFENRDGKFCNLDHIPYAEPARK